MNPLVQRYLNEKKAAENKQRDEFLLREGLYEKAYSPYDEYNEFYPEYDGKYYKKVVPEVTDEEFAEIKKYAGVEGKSQRNRVEKLLQIVAIAIYAIGFIVGIWMGSNAESFLAMVPAWMGAFISGSAFLGFSEIIRLLQEIKSRE